MYPTIQSLEFEQLNEIFKDACHIVPFNHDAFSLTQSVRRTMNLRLFPSLLFSKLLRLCGELGYPCVRMDQSLVTHQVVSQCLVWGSVDWEYGVPIGGGNRRNQVCSSLPSGTKMFGNRPKSQKWDGGWNRVGKDGAGKARRRKWQWRTDHSFLLVLKGIVLI